MSDNMKGWTLWAILTTGALLLMAGCTADQLLRKFGPVDLSAGHWNLLARDPELAERILALDPTHVTASDIQKTLSKGPAPWIFPITPAFPGPVLFSKLVQFFLDMGYPPGRIGDPRTEDFKVDWHEESETIAGMAAWTYERDGMAPMIVGWSVGGITTMSVLHDLNNSAGKTKLRVVNARTGEVEDRDWIRDPYTGEKRPIVGLKVSLAGVLTSGGLGRLAQIFRWGNRPSLRSVPNTVEELLGFQAPADLLGTDWWFAQDPAGLARGNEFKPMGGAKVRTIIADDSYDHFNVIHCQLLSKSPEGRKWVESYRPDPGYGLRDHRGTSRYSLVEGKRNLWCGELWYAIKKHWTLEAQRVAGAVLAGKMPEDLSGRYSGQGRFRWLGSRMGISLREVS